MFTALQRDEKVRSLGVRVGQQPSETTRRRVLLRPCTGLGGTLFVFTTAATGFAHLWWQVTPKFQVCDSVCLAQRVTVGMCFLKRAQTPECERLIRRARSIMKNH